jgi:hypothetical protein
MSSEAKPPVSIDSVSPLAGVLMLDIATPAATYRTEFGADVVKVAQPVSGDPIRTWGHQREGVGFVWKALSCINKSIMPDLREPEGQELPNVETDGGAVADGRGAVGVGGVLVGAARVKMPEATLARASLIDEAQTPLPLPAATVGADE